MGAETDHCLPITRASRLGQVGKHRPQIMNSLPTNIIAFAAMDDEKRVRHETQPPNRRQQSNVAHRRERN